MVLIELTRNISLYINFPCSSLLAKCVYSHAPSALTCIVYFLKYPASGGERPAGFPHPLHQSGCSIWVLPLPTPGLAPPPPGLVHCKGQYVVYCYCLGSLKYRTRREGLVVASVARAALAGPQGYQYTIVSFQYKQEYYF